MTEQSTPLVGVIMGSKSDWETMRARQRNADRVRRAARMPHRLRASHAGTDGRIRAAAEGRGIEVIIAGAGGAAHLPGMAAAHTLLPVLGVPVESQALKGMDSLLSIVQMPGGVPVGTLAIGTAGREERRAAGGRDPGQSTRRTLREKLKAFREEQKRKVLEETRCREDPSSPARPSACSAAASSAACSPLPRGAWATASTPFRPIATRPPARSPTSRSMRAVRRSGPCAPSSRPRVDVVTFEFENVPAATAEAAAECAPVRPPGAMLHITQHRLREKTFLARTRLSRHRVFDAIRATADLRTRHAEFGPRDSENGGIRLRRQRPVPGSAHLAEAEAPGTRWAGRKRCSRRWSISMRNSPWWACAARTASASSTAHLEPARSRHSRCLACTRRRSTQAHQAKRSRSRAACWKSWM